MPGLARPHQGALALHGRPVLKRATRGEQKALCTEPAYKPLFTVKFYGGLMGMFEMNNWCGAHGGTCCGREARARPQGHEVAEPAQGLPRGGAHTAALARAHMVIRDGTPPHTHPPQEVKALDPAQVERVKKNLGVARHALQAHRWSRVIRSRVPEAGDSEQGARRGQRAVRARYALCSLPQRPVPQSACAQADC